ncbi:hypothetical protein E4K10_45390 [Streptomyces sp. T1317-0309]|nr:hypothetical protein E4K10_45390 [Streptomyces sp. T1317-0309]
MRAVLIRERTPWGFMDWTVPAGDHPPERPHRIGVLTPAATLVQRLALRWLARRPAQRLPLLPSWCAARLQPLPCSAWSPLRPRSAAAHLSVWRSR